MKINETHRVGGVNPYRKNSDARLAAGGKKERARDEVNISSEAKELLVSTDHNRQRIDELKRSVSTGTYKVEAGKIAEKLLPHLLD